MAVLAVLIGVAVWLSLVFWFIISVISQFVDRLGARFPRMCAFGMIPRWTFFAPRPGTDDMHLLYRDELADAAIGDLAYVPTIDGRRWYHVIWNPKKYHNKIFCDLASSLRSQLRDIRDGYRDSRIIMLSTPYIMMMHMAMRMPRPPCAVARQFILVRDQAFTTDPDRAVIFLSEFHQFETMVDLCD